MVNDYREVADWAVCTNCNHPNIIWQSWRKRFRCGWCKKDYRITEARKLPFLTQDQYRELVQQRKTGRGIRPTDHLAKLMQ